MWSVTFWYQEVTCCAKLWAFLHRQVNGCCIAIDCLWHSLREKERERERDGEERQSLNFHIWKYYHSWWSAAKFDLYSGLIGIELGGFSSMPLICFRVISEDPWQACCRVLGSETATACFNDIRIQTLDLRHVRQVFYPTVASLQQERVVIHQSIMNSCFFLSWYQENLCFIVIAQKYSLSITLE